MSILTPKSVILTISRAFVVMLQNIKAKLGQRKDRENKPLLHPKSFFLWIQTIHQQDSVLSGGDIKGGEWRVAEYDVREKKNAS